MLPAYRICCKLILGKDLLLVSAADRWAMESEKGDYIDEGYFGSVAYRGEPRKN